MYYRLSFGLFAGYMVLIYLCAFVKASKDFLEFFMIFMEVVCINMFLIEVIMLNRSRDDVKKLLNQINEFDISSQPIIFKRSRMLEQFCFYFYVLLVVFVNMIRGSSVFFPLSSEEYGHIQEIYGYKNPQNRLLICIWIPCVDTSQLPGFIFFYLFELYIGVILSSVAVVLIMVIICILLHFVGQHFVLSKQLSALGDSKTWTRFAPHQRRLKKAHDMHQVRSCILFHQKLLDFRSLVRIPHPVCWYQIFIWVSTSKAA